MSQFLHLLKHDFVLLYRNKIIGISIAVTLVYIAVFKAISHFGNADKILILVIFNDPALLGFLFVGVMVLFEKNENTLQALSVSPLKEENYIFSKAVSLAAVSILCCFSLAFTGVGSNFNYSHYFFASLFTTLLFTFLGFILVAGVNSFNRFLLKAVGVLIALSIPFLGYYNVIPRAYFLWMPTQPCIDLFRASFQDNLPIGTIIYGYIALAFWLLLTGFWAIKLVKKNLKK